MSSIVRHGSFLVAALALSAGSFGCSPTPPSCVYAVSRTTVSVPSGGGSDTVSVTTGRGCEWSATSSASWLTITSGTQATGNGTVAFSAAANGPSARSGSLTIAGQAVAVSQDGVPAPRYALSGKVTDTFIGPGPGIAGVLVTVAAGPGPGSATTDFGGNYTIPDLLAGSYAISFSKPSYRVESATVTISSPASLSLSLSLDVPATPSTSNLTGYWSGTGSYPNDPFKLGLIQDGNQFRGMYVDQHDASGSVSGSYSAPEFRLRVDFGDAVLYLDCTILGAREIAGAQHTSALGNRLYPFHMTR